MPGNYLAHNLRGGFLRFYLAIHAAFNQDDSCVREGIFRATLAPMARGLLRTL